MKLKIKIYSELDKKIENEEYLAIKNDNVIKYIDFANNKMIIDMDKSIIIRENNDYLFTLDFNNNKIIIYAKHLKKEFTKDIITMMNDKTSKSYLVRYKLLDEDIINEFYIKY